MDSISCGFWRVIAAKIWYLASRFFRPTAASSVGILKLFFFTAAALLEEQLVREQLSQRYLIRVAFSIFCTIFPLNLWSLSSFSYVYLDLRIFSKVLSRLFPVIPLQFSLTFIISSFSAAAATKLWQNWQCHIRFCLSHVTFEIFQVGQG